MSLLTKDRAFALVVLLFVVLMYVESRSIPPAASWQPYGSAYYPRLLLYVVGTLAALLLLRSSLASAARQQPLLGDIAAYVRKNPRILGLFALFALYVFALPLIGYLAATAGFLLLSLALLSGFGNWRKAIVSILLVVVVPVVIYEVFHDVLNIQLP